MRALKKPYSPIKGDQDTFHLLAQGENSEVWFTWTWDLKKKCVCVCVCVYIYI